MDKKCHRCQEWLSECRCAESYWKRAEMEARARAKAPELLECLRGLLEAMTDTNIIYSNETGAEIGKARALIAEIEGDSE